MCGLCISWDLMYSVLDTWELEKKNKIDYLIFPTVIDSSTGNLIRCNFCPTVYPRKGFDLNKNNKQGKGKKKT